MSDNYEVHCTGKHYEFDGYYSNDDNNGKDGDYEMEGGLYCDRIPVVPAGAMTVLFTLKLSLTLCCI